MFKLLSQKAKVLKVFFPVFFWNEEVTKYTHLIKHSAHWDLIGHVLMS